LESRSTSSASSSRRSRFRTGPDGIAATAQEIDGEFTVLEGSGARASWSGVEHAYKVLRQKLVDDDAIVPGLDSSAMRFARDQVFASPSAAAAVVVGRTANGRNDWKIKGTNTSFGTWQAQSIDQVAREEAL
jgi:hypothetical protein